MHLPSTFSFSFLEYLLGYNFLEPQFFQVQPYLTNFQRKAISKRPNKPVLNRQAHIINYGDVQITPRPAHVHPHAQVRCSIYARI